MTPILAAITELHLILALVIIFLLFGGKKLPELARGIGEAMKEFKKASRDIQDEPPQTPPPPTPIKPEITASSTQHPSDTKLN
jgi:sec-independent protein translocase protein TatA